MIQQVKLNLLLILKFKTELVLNSLEDLAVDLS